MFLIYEQKHVVHTSEKHLSEMFLMSTHNICFCEEIKKNTNVSVLFP